MEVPSQPTFLDVPALIQDSQPRPRGGWFWYAAGVFLLLVLVGAYFSDRSPALKVLVEGLSALAMMGLMAGMAVMTWYTVRAHRTEQAQVEAAEELVQLRRWPEAAGMLQNLLSRPTRSPTARVQGLIFLGSVLARYHRFADAIKVYSHLLETINLDPNTAHALKLGRAMSLVREEHLFDADRAIADLRREVGDQDSAGLALIQIYRDVKTGHPEEAIDMFTSHLPALREQLGHRIADAYVLAARAYDLLGRADEAQAAYEKATLLTPAAELQRRYPEVKVLADKYPVAIAPPEVQA